MHKYRLIGKKGEGTFSEVLKAQGIKNGKYVAIKCMKNHFDSLDQVNNLREIQALRRLSPHPGIIKLCEVLYDQPTRRLALVFELMDMNIYELIRGRRQYLQEARIKNFMFQLLKSMDHMHRNGIFHRDIKPENILITDDELKLADFGSCRGIYSKQPYTEYISTRWYRAPECLLTDGFYNYKMDMWGVGCVFFEVLSLYPLFPGTNELDQVTKIHAVLGTPPVETLNKLKKHSNSHIDFNFPHKEGQEIKKLIPHCSSDCVDVIVKLLAYDPDDRLSARQAVKHAYFKDLRTAEKKAAEAASSSAADAYVSEDRAHAPSGSTVRREKAAVAEAAEGGTLPSLKGQANGKKGAASSVMSFGGPSRHNMTDGNMMQDDGSTLPPIPPHGTHPGASHPKGTHLPSLMGQQCMGASTSTSGQINKDKYKSKARANPQGGVKGIGGKGVAVAAHGKGAQDVGTLGLAGLSCASASQSVAGLGTGPPKFEPNKNSQQKHNSPYGNAGKARGKGLKTVNIL